METPHIGQEVTVVPVSSVAQDRWVAMCTDLPEGWNCELVHKQEGDVVPDKPVRAWILHVLDSRRRLVVTDSDFGFLPISDRMRPRYIKSLRRVIDVLKGKREATGGAADAFSEVKGMFSRCAGQDQWDWHAVSLALGEPTHEAARQTAERLGSIGSALRAAEPEAAEDGIQSLRSPSLVGSLEAAVDTIAASTPHLPKHRAVKSGIADKGSKEQESEAETIVSVRSKRKLQAANATHAEVLELLAAFLRSQGHSVEANQFVDAFVRLKSGPAFFEVKSVTDENELSQVRHGLSQLYEYRYRHSVHAASLWLVLSRAPKAEWLVDYLEEDRGIHLLWIQGGSICGPSRDRLLESGSEALRREDGE